MASKGTLFLILLIALCSLLVFVEAKKELDKDAMLLANYMPQKRQRAALACISNCNNHGRCVNDRCICDSNYAGDDCSIYIRDLVSGEPIQSGVNMWQWQYFKIAIPHDNNFLIEMTQVNDTANPGDCDIYAKKNEYPTHTRWDWRDITLGGYVRKEMERSEAATWYFGVFGFLKCNYIIKVTVLGQCLEGCNGNGHCINGACFCNPGWSGEACQFQDINLPLDTSVTGFVKKSEWKFYHIRLTELTPQLIISLDQINPGNQYDVDVYVRYEQTPTMFHWDYANGTTLSNTIVKISNAAAGYWYVGAYGFKCPANGRCDYTVRAQTITTGCADKCSEHGTCVGSRCICNAHYTGDYCETRTSLVPFGETVRGYVSDQTWNWYQFNTFSQNPVSITVTQEGGGDCDLFVKAGSRPTRFSYDYQDISLATTFTLRIPQPGNSYWHIGIFGFRSCSYSMVINPDGGSGNDCQNGGTRPNPTAPCQCPHHYSGDNCELYVDDIHNNQLISGDIAKNSWKFYNFSLPANSQSSNIFIHLKETDADSAGEIWLFTNEQVAPSLRTHGHSDMKTNTPYHQIDISRASILPTSRSHIIIGVYGSPYLISKTVAHFKLTVWAPPDRKSVV